MSFFANPGNVLWFRWFAVTRNEAVEVWGEDFTETWERLYIGLIPIQS